MTVHLTADQFSSEKSVSCATVVQLERVSQAHEYDEFVSSSGGEKCMKMYVRMYNTCKRAMLAYSLLNNNSISLSSNVWDRATIADAFNACTIQIAQHCKPTRPSNSLF